MKLLDYIAGVHARAEFDFSFDLCIAHCQLLAAMENGGRLAGGRLVQSWCGVDPRLVTRSPSIKILQ